MEVTEELQKGDDVSSVVSGDGDKSDTMYDSTGNVGVGESLLPFFTIIGNSCLRHYMYLGPHFVEKLGY